MRKFSLSLVTLSLGMALMPMAQAALTPQQQLLDQVRMGEASKREDIVRQSLARLELMAPDDPDVISARMRYMLRQGDNAGAKKQLERLAKLAPGSDGYKQSQSTMMLTSADGRQQLQEARLLAASGHTEQAIAAYEKMFGGNPPEGDLEIEYWMLMAKRPGGANQAIDKLKALDAAAPGNAELRGNLARLMFANDRSAEAYQMLEKMSKSNSSRGDAVVQWYGQIKNLPAGPESVAALQRFLTVFTEGDTVASAREQLAQQQKQLADPAFRARAKGLEDVSGGRGNQAIPQLKEALNAKQNDSEVVGALGQAYSQQGNRALAVQQFEKAIQMDPESDNRGKWDSLLKTNRYWLLIEQGDTQLKANNPDAALQKYQQAQRIDNTDSYAVLGFGDVAVAKKDDAGAERYYQQALRMDRGNSNAIRGLANVYRRQSPERAAAYIQSLSSSQRKSIDDIERSLTADRLEQQATALESQGQWAKAADVQRQRLKLDPDSVWITYRLSNDLYAAGKHSEADSLMRGLAQRKPGDPEQVFAYGLYLSGNNHDAAALSHLNTLPKAQWNDNIHELADRLQFNEVMQTANRLRDGGKEKDAIALLQQQTPSDRIDLTLADWAAERGDRTTAKSQYQKVLQRSPNNEDALLGLTEVLIAEGNKPQARDLLAKLQTSPADGAPSINTQRRVANAWAALGDNEKAAQTYAPILVAAKSQPPSMDSALVMRDAARFQAASGQPQQALETYKDAMVSSGITQTRPVDNDSFTRLTRNDEKDDWLKRGVRSDAADLYRQQDVNVTLDHEYWGSSGTPGYSDLKAHTTMLEVDAPLSDGRMWFRTDMVNMDAGSFKDNGSGYKERWGTCAEHNCFGNTKQSGNGASLAVGWKNDTWQTDIGTTPLGFDVVDVVGGVSYSNDLGPIGYTVNAHRRPISSSLLSFGGQRDPNTNTVWGGVRATGGGLSLSYDKGEANGVWSSLSADTLTGKNVADNWRVRWMTGYYYKLINENNQRLTVGLTNMVWHYEKDLSDYFLGQGGYYSPQKYVSFAVPVTWRKRTENWSWELGASGSWSYSHSNAGMRYPLRNLVPNNTNDYPDDLNGYPDRNDPSSASSSNGFGYTARALVERRISSHWSIGAGIDIQQAKDYTPSHALIFVRYSMAGWQGDMDMPPQPLVPYADF